MGQERRRTPRYPFVADAVVRDNSSGATMNTQVSDLSLNGCYLDMVNPIPAGTPVTVKISSGGRSRRLRGPSCTRPQTSASGFRFMTLICTLQLY